MLRIRTSLVPLALVILAAGSAAQVVRKVPQDFPTIQGAVDASSDSDQIVISAGTYAENVVIDGLSFLNITCKGKVVIAPAAGVGLTLDGATSCYTEKLRLLGGDNGIKLVDSSNNVFFKCRVDDTVGDGIRIEGGLGNQVITCTIKHAGSDAVSLAAGSPDFTDANLIVDSAFLEPGDDGIELNGNSNVIDGCKTVKANGDGYEIDTTTLGTGNHIQNCKAVKPLGAGVIVTGDGNRLKNLKITGAGGNAVEVNGGTDTRIETSKFTKPGGNGWICTGTAAFLTDSKISKPGGNGVWQQGDTATISGNKVSGAGGSGYKIAGDDGSYTGNSSTGAIGNGFDLAGATGNTLSGNKAKGSKGFDLNNPVPADNTVDETNDFKTVGP